MRPGIKWFAFACVVASGASTASQPIPADAAAPPPGATTGLSGFATIERVPPSPFPDRLPPPENRPRDEAGYYARMAGISDAEARRRIAEQQAAMPAFEKLLGTLRQREAGNFTDARMVHTPDWAYVFYFLREPERTLAKYTRNPHFRAARARYDQATLQTIAEPWIRRFA